MTAHIELIADNGSTAASDDFFRSREFFHAEGVTHTLRAETAGASLLVPLVVEPIWDTGLADGRSPYGYPGVAGSGDFPIDLSDMDLSSVGLVSIFIRHKLAARPPIAGATRRNVVYISDPATAQRTSGSIRHRVNKNKRLGFQVERVHGPDVDVTLRQQFAVVYGETMRRTGAADRYYFPEEYFEQVLRSPLSHLFAARSPDGEVAAASIAVLSDGVVHYYLSGTGERHLPCAPMKNLVIELRAFAAEGGLALNLGGGIGGRPGLVEFKRGFANREEHLWTSDLICDVAAYERLSGSNEGSEFFPAYRTPVAAPALG